jgi:hypothetical protein
MALGAVPFISGQSRDVSEKHPYLWKTNALVWSIHMFI